MTGVETYPAGGVNVHMVDQGQAQVPVILVPAGDAVIRRGEHS